MDFHRVLRAVLALVVGLLCVPAQGSVLRLSPQPVHALSGHMEVWVDASGQAGIVEVSTPGAVPFESLPGEFKSRFTRAAVWFRLSLQREVGDPAEWWLEIDNPLLEDIRVYQPNAQGGYDETRTGVLTSAHDRTLPVRVQLSQPGVHAVYVRIRSDSSVVTRLLLWQPQEFTFEALRGAQFWGLYFGIYLLIALIYLMFWRSTREAVHGWYMLYVLLTLGLALQDRGWMQQVLPADWQMHGNTVMRLTMCGAIAAMCKFNSSYLDLARHMPRGDRLFLGVAYGSTALAAWAVLAGYPQQAMQFIQPMALLLIIVSVGVAWRLLRTGVTQAQLFLLAFGLLYVGVLLRFARNLGWLDVGALSAYSYQIGSLVHMLVLSIGQFWGYARLRLEKEAAVARADTEQQQRQEQREFMAMISHEFRTPLGVIGASADNLLRSPRLNDKDQAKCDKILRANERLMLLMDNYLSSERLESADSVLQKTPVNLVALCAKVMEDFEDSPGPGIALQTDSETLICLCDEGLMRIALRNLLENARRHAPPKRPVQVQLRERGASLLISVRDEGAGIPPEELPQIFKRYFRGRHAVHQPGAGLGLHLVERVVQRHGGVVMVESQPGAGCEFCIVLPRSGV